MPFEIFYFNEKVHAQVESWPAELKAEYARLAELLTIHGPELGMPYSKAMGAGLFELRPKAMSLSGRALFCYQVNRRVYVLHCFIKKSQQTPKADLAIARKRLKELQNG
jgi:phage-related protein